MNVALAFNIKKSKPSTDLTKQKDLEFDTPAVIKGITKSLEELGHKVLKVEADESAFTKLKKLMNLPAGRQVDILFNIAEGLRGDARESQIPMYCEVLDIPYTHSNPTTHAITLNKTFTKLILKGFGGFNIPQSFIVQDKNYEIPKDLTYPVIVKPNSEGSSKGIMDANVVERERDLRKRIEITTENFTKEVLVEEYIEGREFTVATLGSGKNTRVLPIIEQKFDLLPKGKFKIASFELKWIYEYKMKSVSDVYECPAKIDRDMRLKIQRTTKDICELLDVRDAARVDYRLTPRGKLYFLEINTLPGINPDPNETSCYPLAARTAGLNFTKMIGKILNSASKRYHLTTS